MEADVRILRLEAMLDVARSAMAAFDRNGKLFHLNFSEKQLVGVIDEPPLLGVTAEEYLGLHTWRTLDYDPIPLSRLPLMRALNGEEVWEEHLILERGPDDVRYLLQNARPLMVNGEMDGAAVLTLDLTALREVSETPYTARLERAVQRSRLIADITTDVSDTTSALDLERITTFAIERMAQDFHADSGALWLLGDEDRLYHHATYNQNCESFDADGYPLTAFEFAHEALDRNLPLVVEGVHVRAPEAVITCMDGAESVLVIPLRIRGERIGVVYLCIGGRFVLDEFDQLLASVWGRQCAQGIDVAQLFLQVEEANQRLIDLVDELPQAVLVVDGETATVRIANRGAEELFHRSFATPVSVHELTLLDIDGHQLVGVRHPLARMLHRGERTTGDVLQIPQPDGSIREVVAHKVPIRDARNHITGGVTVLQDRADFAAMDQARYEFMSVMAHELRNPLTSLRGNLQLLERRVRRRPEGDETEGDLQRIGAAITEADRVGDLVTRMLDVSRVGLGRLDILTAPMDAAELVRDVCEATIARDPDRAVICHVPDVLPVEWDADRMYQVLSNLTQNADRYAPGSPIEVALLEQGELVRISVRDHGPGVPAEIRQRLFRSYYRLDESDDPTSRITNGSRGLGIGLYISARLVQLHGGRLRVNDAEGGGAEFVITMPKKIGA
ncbi:MAG: ATP-binding protein [Thermomicrobiales bacterium]|nr:ATP-binding protein [Thermomicrobiales bacterium]